MNDSKKDYNITYSTGLHVKKRGYYVIVNAWDVCYYGKF